MKIKLNLSLIIYLTLFLASVKPESRSNYHETSTETSAETSKTTIGLDIENQNTPSPILLHQNDIEMLTTLVLYRSYMVLDAPNALNVETLMLDKFLDYLVIHRNNTDTLRPLFDHGVKERDLGCDKLPDKAKALCNVVSSSCLPIDHLVKMIPKAKINTLNSALVRLCPLFLFKQRRPICEHEEHIEPTEESQLSEPSVERVWGFSILFVTISIVVSMGGLTFLPFLKRDARKLILTLCEGLAVGGLTSSAILHLFPQAFSIEHKFRIYFWKILLIFVGIYLFYLIERFMRLYNLQKVRKNRHIRRTSFRNEDDPLFTNNLNNNLNLNVANNSLQVFMNNFYNPNIFSTSTSYDGYTNSIKNLQPNTSTLNRLLHELQACSSSEINHLKNISLTPVSCGNNKNLDLPTFQRQTSTSSLNPEINNNNSPNNNNNNTNNYNSTNNNAGVNANNNDNTSDNINTNHNNGGLLNFTGEQSARLIVENHLANLTSPTVRIESNDLDLCTCNAISNTNIFASHSTVGGAGGSTAFCNDKTNNCLLCPLNTTNSTTSNSYFQTRRSQQRHNFFQSEPHLNKIHCKHSYVKDIAGRRQDQDTMVRLPIDSVAWMIVLGDASLNFIDGLSIGAGFERNILAGISISVAVMLEEVTHRLGTFAVLIRAGMKMNQSFFWIFISACAMFPGLVLGIILGDETEYASPYIFALAGGMFLYMALVDVMREMNRSVESASRKSIRNACKILALQNIGIIVSVFFLAILALFEDKLDFVAVEIQEVNNNLIIDNMRSTSKILTNVPD